jgi:anti-anti-sigma regulatory factor
MKMMILENHDTKPVTILSIEGKVDGTNYTQMIDKVTELFGGTTKNLLLDMDKCENISNAGLLALYSVSLVTCGELPPSLDNGWEALHAMRNRIDEGAEACFKILNLQPKVKQALDGMGILQNLDVYDNLETAIASF